MFAITVMQKNVKQANKRLLGSASDNNNVEHNTN